jgi:Protein of unknown function (DUF3574)
MKLKSIPVLAALAAFALIARVATADVPAPPGATLQGDAARPEAAHWLRSELYFGIGPADAPDGVADARWRAFLDKEVTPRFPDGLTVLDAYGQWLTRGRETPSRLRSKVLVILHEDTPGNRASIDAIRRAWKGGTHNQSVLLATESVEISF